MRSAEITRKGNSDFSIARLLAQDQSARSSDSDSSLPRISSADRPEATEAEAEYEENGSGLCCLRTTSPPLALISSAITFNHHEETGERRDSKSPGTIEAMAKANDVAERPTTNDLPWLRYTRYRPPKLPRRPLTETTTKRRAGVHPRIPFSSHQLRVLEDNYQRSAYLSRRDVLELSASLKLPQNRVKVWFQNRRARDRRDLHLVQKSDDGGSNSRRAPYSCTSTAKRTFTFA